MRSEISKGTESSGENGNFNFMISGSLFNSPRNRSDRRYRHISLSPLPRFLSATFYEFFYWAIFIIYESPFDCDPTE